MPIIDGYDATREIRKIEKKRGLHRTPVIAVSAYALKEDKEKSLDAGCDDHLSKPIKKKSLLAILERHIKPGKINTERSETQITEDERNNGESSESAAVIVNPVFKKVIPGYLEDLKKEIDAMNAALKTDDFESIKANAHNIKGAGGGYGFDEISRIGKRIEDAAKSMDRRKAEDRINELSAYTANVKVTYRE